MNISEDKLIRDAKAFNADALALIYDQFSGGLYFYAYRLLGDENLAKDCVAETFSRFLKALRDDKGPDAYLKAYLYRIAHNWITDVYRRQPPPPLELDERIQASDEAHPEKLVNDRLMWEKLRRALQLLPVEQRQVIVLRFVENWEFDAISEALQKSAGNVRVLQHRALQALKKLLGHEESEGVYEIE